MEDVERRRKASQFWSACEETMGSLVGRWSDEKEYEDFNEYRIPLDKIAAKHGISITSMSKRPFGCKFVVVGQEHVPYQMSITLSGDYSYKMV